MEDRDQRKMADTDEEGAPPGKKRLNQRLELNANPHHRRDEP
jgi:hypothetical protein